MVALHRLLTVAAVVIACAGVEIPAAESGDEATRLVDLMRIEAGATVADIGAGRGRWTIALAERVGPGGHVFATEIDNDLIRQIEESARDAGLGNVSAMRGGELDNGLPSACCDAVLLRLVYHHFTAPAAQRAELRRALRPGGLVAIVDTVPQRHWRQLPGVPDRGGHGIELADLIAEMTADGFEVIEQHRSWMADEGRYAAVFRIGGAGPAASR